MEMHWYSTLLFCYPTVKCPENRGRQETLTNHWSNSRAQLPAAIRLRYLALGAREFYLQ
jgi:hypothetical protein